MAFLAFLLGVAACWTLFWKAMSAMWQEERGPVLLPILGALATAWSLALVVFGVVPASVAALLYGAVIASSTNGVRRQRKASRRYTRDGIAQTEAFLRQAPPEPDAPTG